MASKRDVSLFLMNLSKIMFRPHFGNGCKTKARGIIEYRGYVNKKAYVAVLENIWLGGLLHDIGKIGLSAKLLNNTHNQLSDDMLAEVQQHPLIGEAVLKGFDIAPAVIDFVRYHHEQMDGSGYPFGLQNDQIPLGARIIRVADCFDAITTDRPYQQRKSWIEAVAILRRISGTDLDPELVDAFIVDIKERGLVFDPPRSQSLSARFLTAEQSRFVTHCDR